jgi:hypothetical protein
MAQTVQSIEQRLREKARKELEERINDALSPVEVLLRVGQAIDVPAVLDKNGSPYSAAFLLVQVRKALIEKYQSQAEEDAIKAFLEKVDQLQVELDELKEEVRAHKDQDSQ